MRSRSMRTSTGGSAQAAWPWPARRLGSQRLAHLLGPTDVAVHKVHLTAEQGNVSEARLQPHASAAFGPHS
ncbi:protein of unknown function [Streptomyces murinus]